MKRQTAKVKGHANSSPLFFFMSYILSNWTRSNIRVLLFATSFNTMQYESNPFYLTTKWKRKRTAILRRDHYQCQDCKRYGRTREATEVHHIKHLEDHPELAYDNNNLISLCSACHRRRHPEKGAKGWKRYASVSSRGGGVRKNDEMI